MFEGRELVVDPSTTWKTLYYVPAGKVAGDDFSLFFSFVNELANSRESFYFLRVFFFFPTFEKCKT